MTEPGQLEAELGRIAAELGRLGKRFALVGALAVSIRGEVRFTRDVDIAVSLASDEETEWLIRELRTSGYDVVAIVEHEARRRLSTVRLRSRSGVPVDVLAASSGIEPEIVESATLVEIEGAGPVPVAGAEDLLATKILSMSERRPLDRVDARGLVLSQPKLDLDRVKARLALIHDRGFGREQDQGRSSEVRKSLPSF